MVPFSKGGESMVPFSKGGESMVPFSKGGRVSSPPFLKRDLEGFLNYASQPLPLLAMTKMFRNVVRGFSLVRTTLKGRTTKEGRSSQ